MFIEGGREKRIGMLKFLANLFGLAFVLILVLGIILIAIIMAIATFYHHQVGYFWLAVFAIFLTWKLKRVNK